MACFSERWYATEQSIAKGPKDKTEARHGFTSVIQLYSLSTYWLSANTYN